MQQTILFAILNWGLGHATRSIPLINYLLKKQYKLIICSDGDALALLQKEFPHLIFEKTPAYNASYTKNKNQLFIHLAKQIPHFIKIIKEENRLCEKLIEKHQANFIISDNRYGFYNKNIHSALICHQLRLLFPQSRLFENMVNASYINFLKPFSEIWIPDIAPPKNLSGRMSQTNLKNTHYIGIDSRFIKTKPTESINILAVISGPEPQRTLLEQKIYTQLQNIEGNHLIVRGTKQKSEVVNTENITVVDLATTQQLNQWLINAETVISRCGYTTIMDLIKLNKKAILIPTPAQPEQEHLAQKLMKNKWFLSAKQDELNIAATQKQLINYAPPNISLGYNEEIIDAFVIPIRNI
ncbi:MAG: glycosyltransferase [Chitinophagales bacterium]|nr:glycosyltransferase [Chitinophagales bacterium]